MQAKQTVSEKKSQFNLEFDLDHQRSLFEKGVQYVKILRPATVGGGIFRLKDGEEKAAIRRFERAADDLEIMKFVPASGAATRMFKNVYSWIADPEQHKKEIGEFFKRAEELAFFEEWMQAADKADLETFESGLNSKVNWLRLLVDEDGLNYAARPKGLIPFHQYATPQTPVAEHLKEAMKYGLVNGKAALHFTVSQDFLEAFETEVDRWVNQEPFNEVEWDITYSFQDEATNTIAVDQKGEPVKIGNDLMRRPGGHGALIHNLNALDADLIFIKNIDNVANERLLDETVKYKKVLAGVLLELREDLTALHEDLGKGLVDELSINELRDKWKIRIPRDYQKLKKYLERPIRVCGMVKNEGEPGGGPYWSLDPLTGESLQILEQLQIDPKDSRQQNIAEGATHFNPVDLVCAVRNLKGRSIDLTEFINPSQFLIADKTLEGKPIKALEWPGLWNGAMANWITIFVEVPIATFNPVKELQDLLRENHSNLAKQ